jgi:ATP-dependent Clp protease ATP-binding subunit ClpB
VLFDEVEKAHVEVLNVLLQLLDDGRLTDARGRTVDFKNTVVIMTSNLGSQYIAERAAGGDDLDDGTRRLVLDALRGHFKPEFLNRVDEIIFFHTLGRAHLHRIVDIQLRGLSARLAARNMRLELTDKARNLLVDDGYDPAYGARPLKRTIQRKLLDPLALQILQGVFADGDAIAVGAAGTELEFSRVAQPGAGE